MFYFFLLKCRNDWFVYLYVYVIFVLFLVDRNFHILIVQNRIGPTLLFFFFDKKEIITEFSCLSFLLQYQVDLDYYVIIFLPRNNCYSLIQSRDKSQYLGEGLHIISNIDWLEREWQQELRCRRNQCGRVDR